VIVVIWFVINLSIFEKDMHEFYIFVPSDRWP